MNTRLFFTLGSLLAASVSFAACGPDWDALDPSLGGTSSNGNGGNGSGGNGSGGMPCDSNDNNACTIDTCVDGMPMHTNAPLDTPCAQSGGSVCDGNGKCVECNVPTQCGGSDTDCSVRTCNAGVCGKSNAAVNTPLPMQTPSDCKTRVCDGMGGVAEVPDNADVLDDGKECTSDACNAGNPEHTPLGSGLSCTQDGGKFCNGAGNCVACLAAQDCGVSTDCTVYTCSPQGQCPQNPNLAAGTLCGAGGVCDGMGSCVICSPTLSPQTFQSTDIPKTVPNNNAAGASSTLNVMGLGSSLVKVTALVNISGDTSGDLEITLISPGGTMLDLSSGNGGTSDNGFAGTLFDDAAALRITETTFSNPNPVPAAIPERNLGRLFGENPNGMWTLSVKDTAATGTGATINNWELAITSREGITLLPAQSYQATPNLNTIDLQTITSAINVPDTIGPMAKVTVEVVVKHSQPGQLVMNLVSPQNKSIRLTTGNGGGNDDVFAGTLFDDGAANLIGCNGNGCVTFSNGVAVPMAIPEGSLSSLIGMPMTGAWTLQVEDTANGTGGTFESWKLNITPSLCSL